MMMVLVIHADAEHALPVESYRINGSILNQCVQAAVHCRQADARTGIHHMLVELLSGDEILMPLQLTHHLIKLARVSCSASCGCVLMQCFPPQFFSHSAVPLT